MLSKIPETVKSLQTDPVESEERKKHQNAVGDHSLSKGVVGFNLFCDEPRYCKRLVFRVPLVPFFFAIAGSPESAMELCGPGSGFRKVHLPYQANAAAFYHAKPKTEYCSRETFAARRFLSSILFVSLIVVCRSRVVGKRVKNGTPQSLTALSTNSMAQPRVRSLR